MDQEAFKNLEPVHGLIFLFRVQDAEVTGEVVDDERLQKIFFAKQVINNACATQAILSILLNCQHEDIKLGQTLSDFKDFCQSFDPHTKGLTLSNAAQIRTVHNSFARQTLFELDNSNLKKDEDVYHFIGYIPIDGRLYELDGLKEGPIDLGAVEPGANWLEVVQPIIEKRMQKYTEGEIHFNLMALVSDRRLIYQKKIDHLTSSEAMDSDDRDIQIAQLQSLIDDEVAKRKNYKIENIRRKHNYLPFIMELLKMLGEQGQLTPLYEKAKQRAAEKEQAKTKV